MGPKVYNTAYSQMVTQSGTDAAQQGLTLVIGREPVVVVFFLKRLGEVFYLQIFKCEVQHFYINSIANSDNSSLKCERLDTHHYNVNIRVSFSTLAKACPKHQWYGK